MNKKQKISKEYLEYLNGCLEQGDQKLIAERLSTTRYYVNQVLAGSRGVAGNEGSVASKIISEAEDIIKERANTLVRMQLECMWQIATKCTTKEEGFALVDIKAWFEGIDMEVLAA